MWPSLKGIQAAGHSVHGECSLRPVPSGEAQLSSVTMCFMFIFCEFYLIRAASEGVMPPRHLGPQEGEGGVWGDPKNQFSISWLS